MVLLGRRVRRRPGTIFLAYLALYATLKTNQGDIVVKLFPDHAAKFPKLQENYLPNAYKMHQLAKDHGLAIVFMPAGPLVEFNPDKVKTPPTLTHSASGLRRKPLQAAQGMSVK